MTQLNVAREIPSVWQMVAISLRPLPLEGPRQLELLPVGQLLRPTTQSAPSAGRSKSRERSHADEIALELGQRFEDVEDELLTWCGCIDQLGETLEADPRTATTVTTGTPCRRFGTCGISQSPVLYHHN